MAYTNNVVYDNVMELQMTCSTLLYDLRPLTTIPNVYDVYFLY